LCAEVEKLRISIREGIVLDGDFRTLEIPVSLLAAIAA